MRANPKTLASSQAEAKVLVPYWALSCQPKAAKAEKAASQAAASSQEDGADCALSTVLLQYKAACLEVPTPPAMWKGIKTHKAKIQIYVPCLRNEIIIPKGARLLVHEKLPEDWITEDMLEQKE